ncbi:hypothetical protein [Spartinivicinus poritis]|uniref:Uncharacterized protein n=1 Tax=Spartinivicinus poritis TaxID=2994640 RepID=A0ABT5UHR4_9GAMM|nr:hypothetical protein [Spartinivicinus sp. A2-2]MDE1465933.1 hypothetical protein [Spartinivicinus sp. A2-2]
MRIGKPQRRYKVKVGMIAEGRDYPIVFKKAALSSSAYRRTPVK